MTRRNALRGTAARLGIATILLATSAGICAAQTVPDSTMADTTGLPAELWRVGGYGGAQWLGYTASMGGLPGVPSCCPEYEGGSGSGIAAGVAAELPLLPDLSAGLRVLFTTYGGTLSAEERELVTAQRDTVTAVFGHTIEASQPAIAAEAGVSYRVFEGLRVLAGARFDFMLGGTYDQREEILSPGNIRYENDRRQRLVFEGAIPEETAAHMALTAGLRYDIPLNSRQTLFLSPEVQVWQGLGNLVAGESWTMHGIRIGMGLSFVGRYEPPKPTPPEPVPQFEQKPENR